ncbi:hypothetical protein ACFL6K_02595 [Candidatus Latescibacterota bacterium]
MKEPLKKRPTSITVVAWFMIVTGIISLISATIAFLSQNQLVIEMMSKSPIPIPIQHLLSYVGSFVSIVSGFAILNRENWGRFLYFIWSVVTIVISYFSSPSAIYMIPGLVIFVIFTFILFLSKASDYFDVIEDLRDTEST